LSKIGEAIIRAFKLYLQRLREGVIMKSWRQNKRPSQPPVDLFESFDCDPFDTGSDTGFTLMVDEPRKATNAPTEISRKIATMGTSMTGLLGGRFVKRTAIAAVTVGSLGAIGWLTFALKPWTYFQKVEDSYAFFEVRAVDGAGRPVAGAVVLQGDRKLGVTDSFGEWRRYMKVTLGSTVPVAIAKRSNQENLVAVKNFAVPLVRPEKQDIELKASVQVIDESSQGAVKAVAQQTEPGQESAVKGDLVTKQSPGGMEKNLITTQQTEPVQDDKLSGERALLPTASQTKVAHGLESQDFSSSHQSLWIEAADTKSTYLQNELIPAVTARAKELGLKIDEAAPWKVRLTHIMDRHPQQSKDGSGLFLVSMAQAGKNGRSREFLRNYQPDLRVTARGLLYILAHHVNKNLKVQKIGDQKFAALLPADDATFWQLASGMSLLDQSGREWLTSNEIVTDGQYKGYGLVPQVGRSPCSMQKDSCEVWTRSFIESAPLPQWVRATVKVANAPKAPIKVFVAGYEATPVKDAKDHQFEFWAQDLAKTNVTVLGQNAILLRSQMLVNRRQPPTIAVPAQSLTKR
jgi:hypothetical protein